MHGNSTPFILSARKNSFLNFAIACSQVLLIFGHYHVSSKSIFVILWHTLATHFATFRNFYEG